MSWDYTERKAREDEVFQTAVDLSLEWGSDWLQPINARIRKEYTFLTEEQAESLNQCCKEIQRFCWDDLCWQEAEGKLSLAEVEQQMRKRYPQLSEANLRRLISQGYYYARK